MFACDLSDYMLSFIISLVQVTITLTMIVDIKEYLAMLVTMVHMGLGTFYLIPAVFLLP